MKLIDNATGKATDVNDAQVKDAIQSGAFRLPKGATEAPVNIGGRVAMVKADELRTMFDQGAQAAREQDYRAAQTHARGESLTGAAQAFGAGAVRGAGLAVGLPTDVLALGVADQLAGYDRTTFDPYAGNVATTIGDRSRTLLTNLNEDHALASGTGELAGMIAAAAGTGGGVLGAAGEAGAAGAARLGLGSIGQGALRAGAEGALMGGVGAFNESALRGDPATTAEQILAGVGHGAFMGLAGGAALHGARALGGRAFSAAREGADSLLSRLKPREIEELAQKHFGHAAEGLGDRVSDAYARAASTASGADADAIRNFTARTPEGARARRIAVFDADKVQAEAARALRTEGDVMIQEGRQLMREHMGDLKLGKVERTVKTGNEDDVVAAAQRHIADILTGTDAAISHVEGTGLVKSIEGTSTAAYKAQGEIAAAVASGENVNAKTFMALDELKRTMQRSAAAGEAGVHNYTELADMRAAQRSIDFLKSASSRVQTGLEDVALFGDAAKNQAKINKLWSENIEASRRFESSLTTDVGRDPTDPYRRLRGIDPAKAESYTRNLVNPNADLTHKAVQDYTRTTHDLADAMATSFELTPERLAQVERIKSSARKFGETVESASKDLTLANQYKAIRSAEGEAGGLGLGLGALIGGAPGAALGAVAGAVMRPGKTIAQLAAIERLSTKVDNQITRGVRDFFSGGGASKGAGIVVRGGEEGARALDGKAARAAFEERVASLRELAANPKAMADKIGSALGDLPNAAPQTTGELAMLATRATNFLLSKVPAGMTPRADVVAPHLEPPLYSDTEMRKWNRYAVAVDKPTTVLTSIQGGRCSPEEIEALRVIYPQLYGKVTAQVVQYLAALPAHGKGKKVSRGQRGQMAILLGQPLDSSMTGAMLAALQASAPPPPPPNQLQAGRSINIGTRLSQQTMSESDRLER